MKKAVLYRNTDVDHLLLSDRIVYSTLAFWSIELIDEIHENSGRYAGRLKDEELSQYLCHWIGIHATSLGEMAKATGLSRSAVANSFRKLMKVNLIDTTQIYILPNLFTQYSLLIGLHELSPSENIVYSYLCRSAVRFNDNELNQSISGISRYCWLDYGTVRNVMRGLLRKEKIKRKDIGKGRTVIVLCSQTDIDKYRELQTTKTL